MSGSLNIEKEASRLAGVDKMEKKVEALVKAMPRVEFDDDYVASLIRDEVKKRKEKVEQLGVTGYLGRAPPSKPSLEINKQYLASTIQSVSGHNRRQEEALCWKQRAIESETFSRGRKRGRSGERPRSRSRDLKGSHEARTSRSGEKRRSRSRNRERSRSSERRRSRSRDRKRREDNDRREARREKHMSTLEREEDRAREERVLQKPYSQQYTVEDNASRPSSRKSQDPAEQRNFWAERKAKMMATASLERERESIIEVTVTDDEGEEAQEKRKTLKKDKAKKKKEKKKKPKDKERKRKKKRRREKESDSTSESD